MIDIKNIKKFGIAVHGMVDELVKNKEGHKGGFPICAALLKTNFNSINVNVNSKFICKIHQKCITLQKCNKDEWKNHAEYKCVLDMGKDIPKTEIIGIITIPPCEGCFSKIIENNENFKFFYFIKNLREKSEPKHLSKIIYEEIDPDLFKNKNVKYNIYYIIMSYLEGCLTRSEKRGLSKERVVDISKKWVEKLKATIKMDEPLKEKIKIPKVRLMIKEVKSFNVNETKYKIEGIPFKWIIDNKYIAKNKTTKTTKTTKTNIPKTKTNIPKTKSNVKNDSKQKN